MSKYQVIATRDSDPELESDQVSKNEAISMARDWARDSSIQVFIRTNNGWLNMDGHNCTGQAWEPSKRVQDQWVKDNKGQIVDKYRFETGSLFMFDVDRDAYVHCFRNVNARTMYKAIRSFEKGDDQDKSYMCL